MPEPYKEVFFLRVFAELSFNDIASMFSKTESWARVTFHRAKLKIIQGLKEDYKDLQSGDVITEEDKKQNNSESAILEKMAYSWKKSKFKAQVVVDGYMITNEQITFRMQPYR